MSSQIPDRLQAIVVQSTKDFFLANGISHVNSSTANPPAYQWSGVIGFTGSQITGSLVVACQDGLLNATHPNLSMGMPVAKDDLVDWLGEITNQILGRIKNLSLEYGVGFSLASPSVVKGESLAIPKQGKTAICSLTFDTGEHQFSIFFAAQIDPNFNFDTAVKSIKTVAEGESMLF